MVADIAILILAVAAIVGYIHAVLARRRAVRDYLRRRQQRPMATRREH